MGKIGFVVHGKIHGRKGLVSSLEKVFGGEFQTSFYYTESPRNAELLTRQAIDDGCDFLVALGGDGTLNEVVNGYLGYEGDVKDKPVLGVLPYGTGNDFARGAGITRSQEQLLAMVRSRSVRMIDAGLLNFTDLGGVAYHRYFDNIADLGIGAEVVARVNGVNLRKKILGGTLTFFLSVLWTFLTFRHKSLRIQGDGFEWNGKILGLIVANGRYFGSGFGIAPDASLVDGLFEVVILGKVSIADYIRNFAKLRRSQRIDHPEVFYYKSSRVYAEPVDVKLVAEADGETEGPAPVEFICLKGALPFLMP